MGVIAVVEMLSNKLTILRIVAIDTLGCEIGFISAFLGVLRSPLLELLDTRFIGQYTDDVCLVLTYKPYVS